MPTTSTTNGFYHSCPDETCRCFPAPSVTWTMDDRIFATVNDLIAHLDEPCHKSGRAFPNPIIREILRSLGVQTCPDCHRFTGMAQRVERPLRRKGTGWREG